MQKKSEHLRGRWRQRQTWYAFGRTEPAASHAAFMFEPKTSKSNLRVHLYLHTCMHILTWTEGCVYVHVCMLPLDFKTHAKK